MIEAHPNLQCPPDDAVLWRFMDFTKYAALLQSGCLHFARLTEMQDKFEGALTRPTVEAMRSYFKETVPDKADELIPQFPKFSDYMRGTCCVSCWHRNPHESAAMWKLYLSSNDGIAIRTTFGAMKQAFAGTPDLVFPAVVKYLDYTTETFPLGNGFFYVVHKRKSFEHEAEVRLIWWYSAEQNSKLIRPERGDSIPREYDAAGRVIKVDLPTLVQQVYVSPTSAGWARDVVEAVTRKYGLDCPVIKSDLYNGPVW